jgi:hypothetical protein
MLRDGRDVPKAVAVWQLQLDPTFRELVAHYRARAWAVDIPETDVGWLEKGGAIVG